MPRNTKFFKSQKRRLPRTSLSECRKPSFGSFSIKSSSFGILSSKELVAGKKLLLKHLKRQGKLWVRVFPHIPVTKKPTEVRMGKGKGALDSWCAKVRPGETLFEFSGISRSSAKEIFSSLRYLLSLKIRFEESINRYNFK